MENLDTSDIRILDLLQNDAAISMDDLSAKAHLSRNACWRRIKRMEQDGTIKGRVALLDPNALGCGLTAIVLLKASGHDVNWITTFNRAVTTMPEIVAAHRMAGEVDYMLKVRVKDMAAYDQLYKELTRRVPLLDISASFVMEDIKDTTALPLPQAGR